MVVNDRQLTSPARLATGTAWNLVGVGAPVFVGILAIPVLVQQLGKDRFGLLSLGFLLVGQTSILDFGLSRGLTQLVASRVDADGGALSTLIWTSLTFMWCAGVAAAVILVELTPWLTRSVLNLDGPLADETTAGFRVLALGLPVVVISTGLRGVLEARQRFDLINAVRIPMATLTYAAPVVALRLSTSLVVVFAALVVVRIVACLMYLLLCVRVMPVLKEVFVIDLRSGLPVLSVGGWMTISNLISPVMMYIDRLTIGSLVSVTALTYYAVPYDFVTKVSVLASAISGVVFPAFATTFVRDRPRAGEILRAATKYVFLLLFPFTLVVVALSREGMALWLGASFEGESARVLQVLAVGVFVNGLATIPFALVQGAARPDLTAKLHLCELPLYILILVAFTSGHGIAGTATAWTCRAAVDMVILYILAWRLSGLNWDLARRMAGVLGLSLTVFGGLAMVPITGVPKLTLLGAALAAYGWLGLFNVLSRRERMFLVSGIRRLWPLVERTA